MSSFNSIVVNGMIVDFRLHDVEGLRLTNPSWAWPGSQPYEVGPNSNYHSLIPYYKPKPANLLDPIDLVARIQLRSLVIDVKKYLDFWSNSDSYDGQIGPEVMFMYEGLQCSIYTPATTARVYCPMGTKVWDYEGWISEVAKIALPTAPDTLDWGKFRGMAPTGEYHGGDKSLAFSPVKIIPLGEGKIIVVAICTDGSKFGEGRCSFLPPEGIVYADGRTTGQQVPVSHDNVFPFSANSSFVGDIGVDLSYSGVKVADTYRLINPDTIEYVDKVVEVEVEVPVYRDVEKPVYIDKPIYVDVDRLVYVDKPVYSTVEVPITVEVPVYKVVEKPLIEATDLDINVPNLVLGAMIGSMFKK